MMDDLGEVKSRSKVNCLSSGVMPSIARVQVSDWDRPQAKSKFAAAPRRSNIIDCPQVDESCACPQDGE